MDPPSDRDRGHRPLAFDKMEGLVREMQDVETGVPVRSQKLFLTSIPSAFMGYDLIEWLMERLNIEESAEAVHIANQLCQYGYFFPVSDSKNLIVKDDSSLYRFQTPYYWPWKHRMPDNVEYAIYLAKRTLRNKQRHGLEDYEMESLNSLKKNLQNKWDFITMQAEEQVRLAKERKKGDKIVSDSQERAYWRVYRPPPGYLNHLEPAPVPNWTRGAGTRAKRRTSEDVKREVDFLRSSLIRTRVKVSQALDNLMQHCSTYNEYDSFTSGAQPSNPWVTEDPTFWHLNSPLVENPTEKRVRRWAITMEELVHDPTGLQEFTNYLRKEYSHENIRFWMAVNDLRRSAQSQIQRKVKEIFDEFLAPGAPCEINIDGKTMEKVHQELRNPTRFTFDSAAEHVYTLLLKKDCYPRFIRSEQYKNLLASGVQPLQKKRFFGFGGPAKKKSSTCNPPNLAGLQSLQQQQCTSASTMGRRRGSDRSLSGSVHELAVSGVREVVTRVSHSHSQSNLSDIPYRDPQPCGSLPAAEEGTSEKAASSADNSKDVCPWDNTVDNSAASSSQETPVQETEPEIPQVKRKKSCIAIVAGASSIEVDHHATRKNSSQLDSGSSSSELSLAVAEVSERLSRTCALSPPSTVPPPPEKATHVTSEERVIARIQTVRKYSTTDTRRPSITAKAPSASSDDLAAEDHSLRMYRKSCSTAVRKKSSAAAAPVINIDEPQEQSQQNQESSSDVACAWEEPQAPKVNEICPWEDEESCKVDTPFVKKYATLGYL